MYNAAGSAVSGCLPRKLVERSARDWSKPQRAKTATSKKDSDLLQLQLLTALSQWFLGL